MEGTELARVLAPLVTAGGRIRLAPLHRGAKEVTLRYEHVRNWDVMDSFIQDSGLVHLYDGEEWFTLRIAE